jgi:ribosomal-protein-alanine N-acetyltransferase
MSADDIGRVHEIERSCFSNPWPLESFLYSVKNSDTDCWVIRVNREIAGFFIGLKIVDNYLIADLAVENEFRKRGLASALIRYALGRMGDRGVHRVFLDVRKSNLKAISLYHRFGFRAVGKRRNYYSNPDEDSMVMMKLVENEK